MLDFVAGKPGKVLRITAKKRTDSDNFVSCIRKTLVKGYPGQPVGLGGVFTVAKGEVKTHVMPDFSKVPLKTDEDVANWLKFYNMKAPFTALSFLLSEDPVKTDFFLLILLSKDLVDPSFSKKNFTIFLTGT